MVWFGKIRETWRALKSILEPETCQRCGLKLKSVMYRRRYSMKLCDECWLIMRHRR